MKLKKKEYLKPEINVCFCDTESLLAFGSIETSDMSGGNENGPVFGGTGGGGKLGSKENSGSLWDFEDGDEY